jgi:DmsE family decaheme c-type cytochrome
MLKSPKLFTLKRPVGAALACLLGLLFLSSVYVSGESPPDAVEVGDEVCSACHDEVNQQFQENIHARLAVGDENTCEACHGPGSKHAEDGDPASIYNAPKDFTSTGKNMCAGCHKGVAYSSWDGLTHFEAVEGCGDCHKIHGGEKRLLAQQDPQLCFDCHIRQRSQARMPSHHPVMEGLVGCLDCHSVHSDDVKYTVGDGDRELCLSCHTSLSGPFIFEHEPVNEDCGICHDPHGTVADKLLIQNEPFLCLSCHPMHFHVTLVGYEGEFSAPMHPERTGVSTRDGMKQAVLTKCTQCHSEVHGSDLPSQSISGAGRALTR